VIYLAEVVTPANTTASSPLITTLKVTKGLVYKFNLYMPHGAMGMHYLQVFDGGYQLWPTTPGAAFRGDGIQVDFDDIYSKTTEPWEFKVKSWNTDTTYEHTVWISVGLVTEEAFMMRFLPGMTYERMLETLAKLEAQQAEQKAALLAQPFSWLPALEGGT
jgi:hypothetical protein